MEIFLACKLVGCVRNYRTLHFVDVFSKITYRNVSTPQRRLKYRAGSELSV